VVVVETRTLPDGTQRARIAAEGAGGQVLGWVSKYGKTDHKETLVGANHPDAKSAIQSVEAARRRARAKELVMTRESTTNLFIVRSKLKVRKGAALESSEAGEVVAGMKVYVGERTTLADGTRRALITLADDQHSAPLGWVSCTSKDGRDTLIAEFRR